MNEPSAILRREESLACRQRLDLDSLHSSNMNKSSEEDDGQWSSVVFYKLPHITLEKIATTDSATHVCYNEHKQRNHYGKVRGCFPNLTPLAREDLNTFLKVDEGDIKAENVATKSSHVGQTIARIGNRENPMHDQ